MRRAPSRALAGVSGRAPRSERQEGRPHEREPDAPAVELGRRLAQGPARAFAAVKRLLNASGRTPLPEQLEAEARSIALTMGSADGSEGFQAFIERRPPDFKGR